jgi:ParB/RepB/Spo0J family partition protein
MKFDLIPLDKIRPSPFQPRETFQKEEIEELAESIKGSGLVQPILVRKSGETYEIIAGERRWRAAQFAELRVIPALVRDAGDMESKELSLIENWHRLPLQAAEAENFIFDLYEDGTKSGWYKSVNDMANKIGIPEGTLREIITAHKERYELGIRTGANLTYTDLRETRNIKDSPELRRQVLDLRESGKLSRDDLRDFSKTARESSQPIRKALLELRIRPEEARIIETELSSEEDKTEAVRMIEMERKPDRIVSLVKIVKEMDEARKKIEMMKEVDTGDIWLCPSCKKKFHLIHIEPSGMHKFEEVVE